MNLSDFDGFQDLHAAIHKEIQAKIEERLVTRIEELEGRVPTDEEVSQHGLRVTFPDGRVLYSWKGTPVVELVPPDWNSKTITWTLNG